MEVKLVECDAGGIANLNEVGYGDLHDAGDVEEDSQGRVPTTSLDLREVPHRHARLTCGLLLSEPEPPARHPHTGGDLSAESIGIHGPDETVIGSINVGSSCSYLSTGRDNMLQALNRRMVLFLWVFAALAMMLSACADAGQQPAKAPITPEITAEVAALSKRAEAIRSVAASLVPEACRASPNARVCQEIREGTT